jgi:hypothetical protein
LFSWLEDEKPISARTLVGAPGIGKTRLAIELAAQSNEWTSGFLRNEQIGRFVANGSADEWIWDRPTLILVDYAAQKAAALGQLFQILGDRVASGVQLPKQKLRFLLLDRTADVKSGWFVEVFGEANSWSDQRRALADPGGPIMVTSLSDAAAATSIVADAYERLIGDSIPNANRVLDQLSRSEDANELVGNPLMLQIAALELTPQNANTTLTRISLLDGVVRREESRFRARWRTNGVPNFCLPYLLQLVAIINLCRGATLSRLAEILDSLKAFEPLKRVIEVRQVIDALTPYPLPSGEIGFLPMHPDLVGDLFTARTALSEETVASLSGEGSSTVDSRLWRILDDFKKDGEIEDRVSRWILAAGAWKSLTSVQLDMFARRTELATPNGQKLIESVSRVVTEALKAGEDTVDTLLSSSDNRKNIVARSLLREAYVLIVGGDHDEALRKLGEAKDLQSSGKHDEDSILTRIDNEIECYTAVGDQVSLLNALDEGIYFCERLIEQGTFNSYPASFDDLKSLIDQFEPAKKVEVLTASGLDAVLSETYTLDYRLHQANLILHHLLVSNNYRGDKVVSAVERCKRILFGEKYKLLLDQSCYYREKYVIFESAENYEYADVLSRKCTRVLTRAKTMRRRALHFIFELQNFVIHACGDLDHKNKAFAAVIACLDYALTNDVEVRHRQIMILLFCFLGCIGDAPVENPPKSFYEDLGSYLKRDPPIPDGPFQRLVLYIAEMNRLTGTPAYPDLPQRILEKISGDEEP